MQRLAFTLLLFVILLPISTGQELVYTGEVNESGSSYEVSDEALNSIKPVFDGDSLNITVSRQENQINGLDVFKSYTVRSSNNNLSYLGINVSKEKFGGWLNETGHESFEYIILNDDKRVNFLDNTENGYIGQVYHTEDDFSFSIVGSHHIYLNYTQAINPSETVCTLYWKPNSSYKNVSACNQTLINQDNSSNLENSTNNSFLSENMTDYVVNGVLVLLLIILAFGLALLIPRIIPKIRGNNGKVKEVDRKSSEIIEKIRSGRIPKNDENLEMLDKAKEEAFNDNYQEALNLLDSIGNNTTFDDDSTDPF